MLVAYILKGPRRVQYYPRRGGIPPGSCPIHTSIETFQAEPSPQHTNPTILTATGVPSAVHYQLWSDNLSVLITSLPSPPPPLASPHIAPPSGPAGGRRVVMTLWPCQYTDPTTPNIQPLYDLILPPLSHTRTHMSPAPNRVLLYAQAELQCYRPISRA